MYTYKAYQLNIHADFPIPGFPKTVFTQACAWNATS